MPTAAREPRGTLTAGSLRSPPMLKPAMTPERHPDKRESEAGNPVKQTALPRVVPSSPGAFPGNCHLQQCEQAPGSISPGNWGGICRAEKGAFVERAMLRRKSLLATNHLITPWKAPRMREVCSKPHKGPDAAS